MSGILWFWLAIIFALGGACALAAFAFAIRQRNMQYWLPSYLFPGPSERCVVRASENEPMHVFLAICDHYEPQNAHADKATGIARVQRWCDEYPQRFAQFADCRGRAPQHTFFFPQDEYEPEYLDMLAELCAAGFGDVDIHLHHDNDTADGFREKMEGFRDVLFHRHGLLRRDPLTGEIVYGFIHGNWALCNSRPDGRWCGVNNELEILRETGCYADFTMPSAPSDTQTSTINSIYYASDKPGCTKSHDRGLPVNVGGTKPENSLLMVQGPLLLDWSRRKWGVLPRIENGDLHGMHAPSMQRWKLWLQANVHVHGQPNWRFVKLHTHGCKDGNIDMLLGPSMESFHRQLADYQRANQNVRLYYVTAWEMAQIVRQAEDGATEPTFDFTSTSQLLATNSTL